MSSMISFEIPLSTYVETTFIGCNLPCLRIPRPLIAAARFIDDALGGFEMGIQIGDISEIPDGSLIK